MGVEGRHVAILWDEHRNLIGVYGSADSARLKADALWWARLAAPRPLKAVLDHQPARPLLWRTGAMSGDLIGLQPGVAARAMAHGRVELSPRVRYTITNERIHP